MNKLVISNVIEVSRHYFAGIKKSTCLDELRSFSTKRIFAILKRCFEEHKRPKWLTDLSEFGQARANCVCRSSGIVTMAKSSSLRLAENSMRGL